MKVKFKARFDVVQAGATGTLLPPDHMARECGFRLVRLDEPHPQLGYWGNTIALDLCEVEAYLQPIGNGSWMGEVTVLEQRGARNVRHDNEARRRIDSR